MWHNTSSFPVTFAMAAVKVSNDEVVGVITGQVNKEWQVEVILILFFFFFFFSLLFFTSKKRGWRRDDKGRKRY